MKRHAREAKKAKLSAQADKEATGTRPRRWPWLALALILIGGTYFAWRAWHHTPPVPVPDPDLTAAAGAVAERITRARQALLDAPQSADAWGELGMVLFAHQFEAETNVCFEQAARLNPGDFRWPYLLGVSLAVIDSERAIEQFQQALALNPDLAVIRLRLGELYLQAERLDDAAPLLESALAMDSRDPRVHFDLARLWLARGDLTKARQFAEGAVERAPDTRSVRELLALILQKSGDAGGAAEQLRVAQGAGEITLGWGDPVAGSVQALRVDATSHYEAAETALAQGRTNEAIGMLLQAIEGDDRDPRIYTLLARTLIQSQQLPAARDVVLRAHERHPQLAELQFLSGTIEFFSGNWEAAERAFRRAIELRGDYALAYYNLGHALLKRDLPEDALNAFETSARLRPDHTDSHINAARLHWRLKNRREAEEHLRQAERTATPGHAEVQKLREQMSGS